MAKLRGREDYPIYFGATPEMLRIAGDLRHSVTPAEKKLWGYLRNRKINGYRFRRQHPINEFVVDFFCFEAMLAIEVDGDVHEERYQKERDEERTVILNRLGIKVIRIKNQEIESNINLVIEAIKKELNRIKK